MRSILFIGCAAAVLTGCSKMDTEDISTVEPSSQQQEENPGGATAESGSPTIDPEMLQNLIKPDQAQQLALKWPDGRRFVYEITNDYSTSAGDSPYGVGLDSKSDQVFTYGLTSHFDAGSGNTRLELEFLSAKLKLDGMGNKLEYDSSNENASVSIDPMFSMLAGLDVLMEQKLIMTLTPDGQIKEVEGADELLQKVTKAVPNEAVHIAQGILQEDQFKQLIKYPFLPDGPVKAGETWNRKYTQIFGINGAMDIDNTYTYQGQTTEGDISLNVLTYAGNVDTDMMQNDEMMGMEFSLDGGKNTGVIKLDSVFGHIIESDIMQEMTMVMSIPEAMQGTLPAPPKISIKMSQKIRLKEVSDVEGASE